MSSCCRIVEFADQMSIPLAKFTGDSIHEVRESAGPAPYRQDVAAEVFRAFRTIDTPVVHAFIDRLFPAGDQADEESLYAGIDLLREAHAAAMSRSPIWGRDVAADVIAEVVADETERQVGMLAFARGLDHGEHAPIEIGPVELILSGEGRRRACRAQQARPLTPTSRGSRPPV